ncbi:hypothetical protein SUDANB91_00046 [Streptomyces sp. SudanB91_2054]
MSDPSWRTRSSASLSDARREAGSSGSGWLGLSSGSVTMGLSGRVLATRAPAATAPAPSPLSMRSPESVTRWNARSSTSMTSWWMSLSSSSTKSAARSLSKGPVPLPCTAPDRAVADEGRIPGATDIGHEARRTRLRSSAEPVRPNIWRLSMLIRLTWPSATPEFQGSVRPAMTASRSMPAAKAWRLGWSSWQTASSHCGSCSPLTFGEHVGEGPDVTGQGAEFRAVGRDGLEPELFDLGQRRGSAGDPSGHHAGYWRIAKDWLDHRLARGTRRRTATAADGKAGDWLAPPPPHDLGRGRLRQPEGGPAALN